MFNRYVPDWLFLFGEKCYIATSRRLNLRKKKTPHAADDFPQWKKEEPEKIAPVPSHSGVVRLYEPSGIAEDCARWAHRAPYYITPCFFAWNIGFILATAVFVIVDGISE